MTQVSDNIPTEELLKLHEIGFKLVPLSHDAKTPAIEWTPIYENPDYWTLEKLMGESHRFNNVATTFGKTRHGLYLYELDIDSEAVYNILFNLKHEGADETYSFVDNAIKTTYVTKPRKPNGFHIYWLSSLQHEPILTKDCRPGFEFEIKSGKTGVSSLPPSTHRNDASFRYRSFGQPKLFVSDEMYDRLISVLAECLRTDNGSDKRATISSGTIELKDIEIELFSQVILPYYKNGCRHSLVYGLSGVLHKSSISKHSTIALVEILAVKQNDEELRSRITTVEETYQKDAKLVSGNRYLLDVLESRTDVTTAKDVLNETYRIIGKGSCTLWLPKAIMTEYTFKTMRDNHEIWYYDGKVYVNQGESVIQKLCELMHSKIKTHEVTEVVNHISRRSRVDRSKFDSNPDILNLDNGLLNIHTGEFTEHSSDYLSFVRIPIKYDPKAKCPEIMKFLHEALKPKDILTALEFIGYCIYRSAKYEKAMLCIGGGDNGKGTFLKLIEHFVGANNVSHVSLQDMNEDRFSIARLYGKLIITYADLPSEKLKYTGIFKMLCSGDFIRAQKKGRDPFDFTNFAKLIFSANQIPQSDDRTYAYFKRWIIFHFEYTFTRNCRDTNLIHKLSAETELSGLLNLALIALKKLIKDNEFIYADDIKTVEENYLKDSAIVQFLSDKCIINVSEKDCIARDLYHAYIAYCKSKKFAPVSDNVFGMEIQAHNVTKQRRRVKGSLEYCYLGVKLC